MSQLSGGKQKGRRVRVNLCKYYSKQQAEILGLVVAATVDPDLEQPKTRLLGRGLTDEQQAQLQERLQKWSRVLCDSTGKTDVLCHDNETGDSPPIRSPPYQIADK